MGLFESWVESKKHEFIPFVQGKVSEAEAALGGFDESANARRSQLESEISSERASLETTLNEARAEYAAVAPAPVVEESTEVSPEAPVEV